MEHGKVLVVDDEHSIRKICSLYLKAEGLDVTTMEDARRIIDAARSEKPDVIILDLNMPGTDGFTAAKQLKNVSDTAIIPVLILSGRSDVIDKQNALMICGADDYLTKPFDPAELVARIAVLRRRKLELEKQTNLIQYLETEIDDLRIKLHSVLSKNHRFDEVLLNLLDQEFIAPMESIKRLVTTFSKTGHNGVNGDLKKTIESAQHLEHLLDKLVEWRQYRSGEVTPNYTDIRLGVLIDPLKTVYDERAAGKGMQFNKYCPNSDYFIRTDPERVRRLLRLLLDHAFENNDVCSVEFTASVDTNTLQFTIAGETEIGEEVEMITALENSNGKTLQTRTHGEELTGAEIPIKLPLARNIVELLGGKLTVSSAGTQGTSFSVILPINSH